jgi:hypothetical protein
MKRPLRVLYTGKASCEAEAVTCSTCYAEIAQPCRDSAVFSGVGMIPTEAEEAA